jgi:hypothetical protein
MKNAGTRLWTIGILLAGLGLIAGCEGAAERLNAPPQGQTDRPSELQDNYARMVDGALLSERSISPAHFVPNTTELNGVGVRRLNRYATLLKVYGGPLHYDGLTDCEELANKRMDRIRDYLVSAGLGPDHFKVDLAVAGGGQFKASEAGIIRDGTTPVSKKDDAVSVEKMKEDAMTPGGITNGQY